MPIDQRATGPGSHGGGDPSAPAAPFVCITEFGVKSGRVMAAMAHHQEMWESIHRHAGTSAQAGCELLTFGASDLATIHVVPDVSWLAVPTVLSAAEHIRTTGAAILSPNRFAQPTPGSGIVRSWAAFQARAARFPFTSVMYLKLDPLANILCGSALVNALLKGLEPMLQVQLVEFNKQARSADQQPPHQDPIGNLGSELCILPLMGLDSAEVVLLVRLRRLDLLGRLGWALRRLRVEHLPHSINQDVLTTVDTQLRATPALWDAVYQARRPDENDDPTLLPHEWCEQAARFIPLLAHSATTVGMDYPTLLRGGLDELPSAGDEAFTVGRLLAGLRALPGSMDMAGEALRQLHAVCTSTPTPTSTEKSPPVHSPYTFSSLGRDDLLYIAPEPTTPWTVRDLAKLLRLTTSTDPQDICHQFTRETLLAVKSFPPGVEPHREEHPRHRLSSAFYQTLESTSARWTGVAGHEQALADIPTLIANLDPQMMPTWAPRPQPVDLSGGSAYGTIKQFAKTGGWSYSRTNAALHLVSSLSSLLSNRVETESFLDLAEPMIWWIRAGARRAQDSVSDSHDDAGAQQIPAPIWGIDRYYRGMDRLVRARGRRGGAHRQPDVLRSFEAPAGHELARNGLLALLVEILRERGHTGAAPLLIDGPDAQLTVKAALATGIFQVSALRLQHPALWPAIAHECEHVRLGAVVPSQEGLRALAELLEHLTRRTGRSVPPIVSSTLTIRALLEHLLGFMRGADGGDPHWRNWRDVATSVSEALADMAILDGATLPRLRDTDDYESTETRRRLFLHTLMPNIAMDTPRHPARGLSAEGQLNLLAGRLTARLQTSFALSQSSPRQVITRADINEQLRAAGQDSLIARAVKTAIADHSVHLKLQDPETAIHNAMAFAQTQTTELLDGADWEYFAALLHTARVQSQRSVAGGACAAIADYLGGLFPDEAQDGRVYSAVHKRGGLKLSPAEMSRHRGLQLRLLEALRLPVQRWRALGMQAFMLTSIYTEPTPRRAMAFPAPLPFLLTPNSLYLWRTDGFRWAAIICAHPLRPFEGDLVRAFLATESRFGRFTVHGRVPQSYWAAAPGATDGDTHDGLDRLDQWLSKLGLPRPLGPGVRIIVADPGTPAFAIVSLDPSILRQTEDTRPPYEDLVYYTHRLLDAAANRPDTLQHDAHLDHPPPPNVWVNDAVLAHGSAAAGLPT